MKCPKCGVELVPAPEQQYKYIEPFVPARDHCPEHGYQPVPPVASFTFTKKPEKEKDERGKKGGRRRAAR